MRRIEIFRLCLVVLATTAVCRGFDGAAESQTANPRSDDPRIRWETERARWDDRRGVWDTEPVVYSIVLPDFHHSSRKEWRDQSNEAYGGINKIANEALFWVGDSRLTIEQRTRALSIVELFSINVTAEKLIKNVDLYDPRTRFSSEIFRGRYPVVTVLKRYGQPVAPSVEFALMNESDPKRRELLCEILQHVLGDSSQPVDDLMSFASDVELTSEQSKNLKLALEELQRPRTEE